MPHGLTVFSSRGGGGGDADVRWRAGAGRISVSLYSWMKCRNCTKVFKWLPLKQTLYIVNPSAQESAEREDTEKVCAQQHSTSGGNNQAKQWGQVNYLNKKDASCAHGVSRSPCVWEVPPPLAQARPRSQKSGQNGGSTPTPCLDKAVHAHDTCDSQTGNNIVSHD